MFGIWLVLSIEAHGVATCNRGVVQFWVGFGYCFWIHFHILFLVNEVTLRAVELIHGQGSIIKRQFPMLHIHSVFSHCNFSVLYACLPQLSSF
jgi:hypothetical protein